MVSVERTFQVEEATASAEAGGGSMPGVFEGWVRAGGVAGWEEWGRGACVGDGRSKGGEHDITAGPLDWV